MKPMRYVAMLFAFVVMSFAMAMPQASAEDWLYTVRKGDTIWGLSHKYLKEPLRFQEIQQYNDIKLDRQLPPGITLKFPMEYLKFAPAEVTVTTIKGTAHYVRRGIKSQLTLEDMLVLDDILVTENDSSVALLFADGSKLLLGEKSELIFDLQTQWGETGMVDSRMRLMKGSAEGRVKPLIGPGAHFEVQTPSAVATVRGTEFRVRLDEDDPGVVFNEVDEGRVAVQLHENKALVKQGFGLRTSTSQPMTEPRRLLPAPQFVNARDKYPGHPVTLDWQSIDGAQSYQVELFKDAAMTQLVQKSNVQQNQFTLPKVELADYTVRVRAVDQHGLQGLNNSKRFSISLVPSQVKTRSSTIEVSAGVPINTKWQKVEGANQYRWRLATDRQFSNIVMTKDTPSTAHQLPQGLAAGDYYWQVAAGNENGFGVYSAPVAINVILPEPPTLKPLASEHDSDEVLELAWSSVELATSYYWQVSDSAGFKTIMEEGETEDTHVMVNDLPEQRLYFRVAAKGPFNQQRFSSAVDTDIIEPGNGKAAFSLGSLLIFILLL